MRKGLIIGKFMPLHTGHLKLIEFGLSQSDELTLLVCANPGEPIPGSERLKWLWETYRAEPKIKIEYTEEPLPNSSVSSRNISKIWASYLSRRFPEVSIIFSSEKYGDYLAEYMGITHKIYDELRQTEPISASIIRNEPFTHWNFIPLAVRPYFTKKVCIYGTESTGKTTLTKKLASHYQTAFVPEMAREVLGERGVEELVWEDFPIIAQVHAQEILKQVKNTPKILFCDTDILTTQVYARRYFNKELEVPEWILSANQFDLYLFLDKDVPWVADIHRNSKHLCDTLHSQFLKELEERNLPYELINGNWETRFERARMAIEERWL